jgi:hypothetical protein
LTRPLHPRSSLLLPLLPLLLRCAAACGVLPRPLHPRSSLLLPLLPLLLRCAAAGDHPPLLLLSPRVCPAAVPPPLRVCPAQAIGFAPRTPYKRRALRMRERSVGCRRTEQPTRDEFESRRCRVFFFSFSRPLLVRPAAVPAAPVAQAAPPCCERRCYCCTCCWRHTLIAGSAAVSPLCCCWRAPMHQQQFCRPDCCCCTPPLRLLLLLPGSAVPNSCCLRRCCCCCRCC